MEKCNINLGEPFNRIVSAKIKSFQSPELVAHFTDENLPKAIRMDIHEDSGTVLDSSDGTDEVPVHGLKRVSGEHELYVSIPKRDKDSDYMIRTYGAVESTLGRVDSDSFVICIDGVDIEFNYDVETIESYHCSPPSTSFAYSLSRPDVDNTLGFDNPIVVVNSDEPFETIYRVD